MFPVSPVRFGVRIEDLQPGKTYIKSSSTGSYGPTEFHVTGTGADVAGKTKEGDLVTITAKFGPAGKKDYDGSDIEGKDLLVHARQLADGHLRGVEEKA